MADLQKLQDFAAANSFGLTRPLTHAQVVRLAEYWLPEMRFYENEKFYPISLEEVGTMVNALFSELPASAQDEWRVSKFVRTGGLAGEQRKFDPPVVHVPDGVVEVNGTLRTGVRVIGDGSDAEAAFEHPDVDADAVVTHGASFRRSDQFFGARETLSGGNVPTEEDPFVPRATNDGAARITFVASFKSLLDTLKYELLVEDADDYPPDGLRGGFDIAASLFTAPSPQSPEVRRKALLEMIAAFEAGEGEDSTNPPGLPPGWRVNKEAWDAVTRYVFLEYDCYYAYNDFVRVQDTLLENEHEGDNEGCCLVFERNVLNVAAAADDPDLLLHAVPHAIITSVHEEFQDADLFSYIPPPIPPADDLDRLPRDDIELIVWVAWGSHATYLSPGDHDLVDFGDMWGFLGDKAAILAALAPGLVLSLALLAVCYDHLFGPEDKTSDDGIRTGPQDVLGDHPLAVDHALMTLPMSSEEHIYQPQHQNLLRRHAFPGKWGAHDGLRDKSPRYEPKTGRYFRKLLTKL